MLADIERQLHTLARSLGQAQAHAQTIGTQLTGMSECEHKIGEALDIVTGRVYDVYKWRLDL
jgi:hypothetical protein